jgi:Fic family protein
MYIWQLNGWPSLTWDQDKLTGILPEIRHKQGVLLGRMSALGFPLQEEALLHTLTHDVLKSSEIEGEKLNPEQVRSSIARRLGMDVGALPQADRDVEGVVEMMLDATQNFQRPLTKDRLWGWHAALFPTGRSGLRKIRVGMWRDDSDGPMQVVSGPIGREKVHYEAPPAKALDKEMEAFLDWFNTDKQVDPVIKAGLAHLWFVTIHPFEDGNGRIARAIADLALARSENSPQRFYSMSSQIRAGRNAYYNLLERTQKGNLNVTDWLLWFLECLGQAIDGAQTTLQTVMAKAHFWETHSGKSFNSRQRMMLNRLLDGFAGNLTTGKWAKIAKCSQDTAYRDILELVEMKILAKGTSGGRSTNYELVPPER